MNAITLTPSEQRICRYLAGARHAAAREAGKVNARKGPQDDAATDLEGIGGEIAFCKLFGVYPDLSIAARSPEEDKGDCVLPSGAVIDVKTTKYDNGRLLVALWKHARNIDLYALMVGQMPTYELRGWITPFQVRQKDNIIDLGRGPVYAVEQARLLISESAQKRSVQL